MNKKAQFFSPQKLSLAIASALVSMAAIADDNNPEPILVQATKPAATLPFSAAVTPADIAAQRAATSDTASLLRDIPGVSLYGAGGVSSLPAIHGLADDRLRIKVDGMDLLSSCPNHMNSPLSYLDPSQVETLKVYAGITPVSVGGDSIGGTIIAETTAPEFAAAGQSHLLKGRAGALYRSNNNARGGNLTATYATDMLNITYSGATTQADNYTAGGDFKTTSATGRPGHTLPLNEVGSTAYKANNHALNLALKNDNHLFEARLSFQDIPYEGFPNQRMDMLENTAHRINLHYLGEFGWGSLDARAYHETVTHFMNFGDDKQFWYGDAPGMPMHTESKNTGGVVKAHIQLTSQDLLRVGGEYQRYQLNDWWPASGTGMMMAPNTFWNINDGQRDRTALFGEWESRINPAWTTLLGARYERVKTNAGPVQGYSMLYAADANTFNARSRERTDNNWDATALARYTADATRTVEFGYAMKTRSPNLYERYSWSRNGMALEMNNFVGDGNGYLGDPDLKTEKAHTLSTTFDWHAPDRVWEFKATTYYTYVTDYIDARRCGSGMGMMAPCGGVANNTAVNNFVHLQYANQSARLYGLDLSGHMPLGKTGAGDLGLKGLLNYTNGRNRDTSDNLYNIMPLNAKLTLTQKRGGWDNGVELVMVKAKNNISDVRNEIKTPGYGLVNLRGSYTWKQVRVDFGVENLFDKLYYLPTGGAYTGQGMTMSFNGIPWGIATPGMGRSLYTGLSYAF